MILLEFIGVVLISIVTVVLYKRNYVGNDFLKLCAIALSLSLFWELSHYVAGKKFLSPSKEIQKNSTLLLYSLSHAFYDMLIFLLLAGAAVILFGKKSIFNLELRVLLLYLILGFAQEYLVEKYFSEQLKMWKYHPSRINPTVFGHHTIICFVEWICAVSIFWLASGLL